MTVDKKVLLAPFLRDVEFACVENLLLRKRNRINSSSYLKRKVLMNILSGFGLLYIIVVWQFVFRELNMFPYSAQALWATGHHPSVSNLWQASACTQGLEIVSLEPQISFELRFHLKRWKADIFTPAWSLFQM